MEVLDYIIKKYNLDINTNSMPIEIPNIGRNNLAEWFRELNFTIGVEIGVERGLYSEILIKSNPGMKLYSVDPWSPYHEYREHIGKTKFDELYNDAKNRLEPLGVTLIKKFSMDAVKDFKDRSLDFVYIDGNHSFQHCTNDIVEWSKKVKKGGIISGHDWVKHVAPIDIHVYEVTKAYTDSYRIIPWFILGSKAKIEGTIRDENRSFMWINK